ncbi:MAG: 3-oxoadipate enol-lactonase [Acidobacteriia bacterium]|nr:3-oxoadipate enol-lactonase [Terriglobia bacterium]
MPLINANGLRQYYRVDGREDRPVVVFSHSLGCDHSMWDAQAAALAQHFLVLRYDTRGHGATEVPGGDYDIATLAADAIALLDALGVDRFAWCGLSLGGMIGQRLAAKMPERVTNLILANTSARVADPNLMEARRRAALEGGMSAVVAAAMERFFTADVLAAGSSAVAGIRRVLVATNRTGYAGCCAAIRDMDNRALLGSIRCPSLIISGEHDVSTPWSGHGEVLAREIAGAQVERLPAAHLSNLEKPRSFTAALLRFLIATREDTLSAGSERRRAVLGDAHVDRSTASASDFTRAFQELITRYAWGTIWQRPGLDDRTRRLLVLAITASLSRWDEFRLHLAAGLAHELEPCDLEEALLQVAVYAGVPAANTGFHLAKAELAQETRAER